VATKIPSEFVPLDVNYAQDRAIRVAGPLAEALFVRGIAYARKYKTGGLIPDYDLVAIGAGIPRLPKQAEALVKVRLWLVVAGGWRVRSWGKWNPVSEEDRKAKQSRGGALGNHNRWHLGGVASDDCEFCGPIATESVTDRLTESVDRSLLIAEVEKREERTTEAKTSSSLLRYVPREAGAQR
jgi:hypothetical protein